MTFLDLEHLAMQIISEVSPRVNYLSYVLTSIHVVWISAGAGAALFGTLGAGAAAGVPQGFTSGAGQIPAGVAIPGAFGGGILLASAPSFVAGVALLLVPFGLSAVSVFPPFERPRSPGFENTVAVIHTEDEDLLQPRHLRKQRNVVGFDEVPSKKSFCQVIKVFVMEWPFSGFTYFAFESFTPEGSQAMSLIKGEKLQVEDKSSEDWWYVTKDGSGISGWVPASYLIDEQSYNEQKLVMEKVSYFPVSSGKWMTKNAFSHLSKTLVWLYFLLCFQKTKPSLLCGQTY